MVCGTIIPCSDLPAYSRVFCLHLCFEVVRRHPGFFASKSLISLLFLAFPLSLIGGVLIPSVTICYHSRIQLQERLFCSSTIMYFLFFSSQTCRCQDVSYFDSLHQVCKVSRVQPFNTSSTANNSAYNNFRGVIRSY